VACAPASDSPFAVGATTVNCTSSDNHGNTSSASFTVTVVDRTRPTLTLPGPITATATSVNGAVVTYSATAYDAVDGSITPVCAPPSGATFHLGVTTVNCTATDAAGNQASGSFQVTVQYGWSGFLPPIDPAGGSRFNKGSTVPVKFKLTGKSAGITNLVARLYVAKVVNGVVGPYALGESTPPCEDGAFRYDASGKQYIFNLSTKKMSTGTWSLRVDLGDGVTRVVQISLK